MLSIFISLHPFKEQRIYMMKKEDKYLFCQVPNIIKWLTFLLWFKMYILNTLNFSWNMKTLNNIKWFRFSQHTLFALFDTKNYNKKFQNICIRFVRHTIINHIYLFLQDSPIIKKMEWTTQELSRNMTTSSTMMLMIRMGRNSTYQPTKNNINKNMIFSANTSTHLATALIHLNDSNHQIPSFHPAPISLAYSGYKGMKLAPWLTGIIFALVVFVILIPAFCSACYHYYR